MFLGFNDSSQLKDANPYFSKLIQNGATDEILESGTVTDRSEDVESAKLGEEEMRPQGFELSQVRLDMAPGGIAIAGLELPKRCKKTVEVLRSFVVHDIQVERQDRRPLKLSSHSTDNQEINPVAKQGPEEPEELNAR